MIDYVSLHNHTSFSLMRGLMSPDDLIKAVKAAGQNTLAITDVGTFAGLWDALKAANKAKVKLIAGCEFNFVDKFDDSEKIKSLILLAKNAEGYKNLLTLGFKGYDNSRMISKKVTPIIDWELLNEYKEGLICITGDGNGIIAQSLMYKQEEKAIEDAVRLHKMFGHDDFALELCPNALKRRESPYSGSVDQVFINRRLKKISEKIGCRSVVATNSYYELKEHHEDHNVLLAIGSGQPIGSQNRLTFNVPDFYVKNAVEVASYFTRHANYWGEEYLRSLFENSIFLADRCEHAAFISPVYSNPSGKELPNFPVKDEPDYDKFLVWKNENAKELDDDVAYMRYICFSKLENIPESDKQIYLDRLNEEFEVLEYHGFSSYMLIVADFINWAKKHKIKTGHGRGCLTGDTEVLTEKGFSTLKEITDGIVYTHTGELKEVLNKFEYDVDETGLEIKSEFSFTNIKLTKDHKVFASKSKDEAPKWIKAEDLKVSDYIYTKFPENRSIENPLFVDLGMYMGPGETCDNQYVYQYGKAQKGYCKIFKELNIYRGIITNIRKDKPVDPELVKSIKAEFKKYNINYNDFKNKVFTKANVIINFDEEFCYFLGRWVGDGWIDKENKKRNRTKYSYVCFNSNEANDINRIKRFLKKNNIEYATNEYRNCTVLVIKHIVIWNMLRDLFPDYNFTSDTKHLPVGFRKFNNKNLKSLIAGLVDSDGWIYKSSTRIETISKRLALEIKEALLYIRCKSSVGIRKKRYYKKYLSKKSYIISFNYNNITTDPGYYSKITSVSPAKLDKVYDITVKDDTSYLTTNGVVHNSCGGSLVAYFLGIHVLDPIKYKLIFARFHNKEKTSFPDIDTDFVSSGRDKVQEYIMNKYGEDYVAFVSNKNTIKPKVYVKDISRVFEFGDKGRSEAAKIGQDIADSIPSDIDSVDSLMKDAALFVEYTKIYPQLAKYINTIGGTFRAWSTHAGGLVVGKRPLTGLVPLRRDEDGRVCLEYDKYSTEDSGLVKIDILGVSTLDVIDDTYKLVKEQGKEPPPEFIDFNKYDEKTYDLISSGNTLGIFQLAGTAVQLCKELQPKTLLDIGHINALIRPSAAAIREDFIKTKNGLKPVELPHPILERSFGDTYGFGLYEECLMYLAQDVAGWSLHEADRLRKLTKGKGKYNKEAKKWREEFIEGGKKKLDQKIVEFIWDEVIEKFSGYGFNVSHALFYSVMAFETAYLKAHYPLEFLLANLMKSNESNSPKAKEDIIKIKSEIRKSGISIVNPDINLSEGEYKIKDDKTLISGLKSMKFVNDSAIPNIVANRPYYSLEDFLKKVDLKVIQGRGLQSIAASGGFDEIAGGLNRKQLFYYIADFKNKFQLYLKRDPKKRGEFKYPWPAEKDFTIPEKYALETHFLGEGVSGTITERYTKFFSDKEINFLKLRNVFKYSNKSNDPKKNRKENTFYLSKYNITGLKGIVTSIFSFKVKKEDSPIFGQLMARIEVQDIYGNDLSIIAFPDSWDNVQNRIKSLSAGRDVLSPGVAIYFTGAYQYENELSVSFIIDDILDYQPIPKLPSDIKSRKVKMPRAKRDIKIDEIDQVSLSNLLEEEMIEDGLYSEES